jgi:tetratricopeptide (TPR) repeat protein
MSNRHVREQFLQQIRLFNETPGLLTEGMDQGASPRDLLRVPESLFAEWLAQAEVLLREERDQEASHLYRFLAALEPHSFASWIGVAMSAHRLHYYFTAIDAYEVTLSLQPDHPLPYLLIAKTLFAIHEKENARAALEQAIEYAEKDSAFSGLEEEASSRRRQDVRFRCS